MRPRSFILVWTPIVLYNAALAAWRLDEGKTYSALFSLGLVAFCLVVATFQARYTIRPRRHRLNRARVEALEDSDLDLLEVVLRKYDGASRVYLWNLRSELPEELQWERDPVLDMSPKAKAAFDRLVTAGLLEDARVSRRDRNFAYKPIANAQELLETERERRESVRVAPLGPRSRPGALSS